MSEHTNATPPELIGKTPVECLQDTDNHKIPLSGSGILTFKKDARFRDAKGASRRIEWLTNQGHISYLTGVAFNKPGQPRVFAVAYDILGQQEKEVMRPQVEPLVREIATAELAKFKAAIEDKLTELEASVEVLRNQAKIQHQAKARG
jgi:hypothetical protein